MKFFRRQRNPESSAAQSAPSRPWTYRFNPFKRSRGPTSQSPAVGDVGDVVAISPISITPVTTPGLSEASSPVSETSSRRSSVLSTLSPSSSIAPPIPPKSLERQNSVYSHRSLSIRRDSSRPPSAIPRAPAYVRPTSPKVEEEDCLVITATSKYPSGVLGELYIPENCSYKVAMERNREARKAHIRNQISRNGALLRRHSGVKSSEERWRIKRCSVNF